MQTTRKKSASILALGRVLTGDKHTGLTEKGAVTYEHETSATFSELQEGSNVNDGYTYSLTVEELYDITVQDERREIAFTVVHFNVCSFFF